MSQGGEEVTTQQVVYGPDGKAYGNPAIARNAGVNQYYREDGTPYPVAQQTLPTPMPYNQPMPAPSFGGLGGTDPYSRIMGQMGAGTPYQRIMGQMPLLQNPYASMSGGYNNFQGGYNPNLYSNAPRAIGQLGFGGGGGGGGGSDNNQPLDPRTAAFFDNETPYAREGRMLGVNSVLQGLVNFAVPGVGFVNALPSFLSSAALGRVNNALNPTGLINYGIPVEDAIPSYTATGLNAQAMQSMQDAYNADMAAAQAAVDAAQNAQAMQSMQDALNADTAAAQGGGGGGGGEGIGGGDISGQSEGTPALAMGGLVDRVGGPNPPGPDDGAGMLQIGEYVIKKSAVKKYGAGLLDMINNGKIPAKKMKSLLG